MFQWARSLVGRLTGGATRPPAGGGRRDVRARYDSAQTTDENSRLWAFSDNLSAKAANSYQVRQILRRRSRYAVGNNSYAQGITANKANDLIGTGPTLQVRTASPATNRKVEAAFAAWVKAVGLVEKLRTLALAKIVDGEGFLVFKNNPAVDDAVQLYPLDLEADQVTTPAPQFTERFWVDGLVLDEFGNPVAYHVLKQHPGDLFLPMLNPYVADTVPARLVIHWFRKDRPGQARGVPELTPGLDLFEENRAYRKSVLANARVAASLTAVLETQQPASEDEPEPGYEPFKTVPVDNGMLTQLPAGTKLSAFTPAHPITGFDSFTEKLLAEACRSLNIPLNVALGSSQKFNFSSARLDHVNYRAGLVIERSQCEAIVLERVFAAWLEEAVMVPGLIPAGITTANCPHEWHWPGFEPLDPKTDADADAARLAAGTMTFSEYWARRGKDWRDQFQQLAEEKRLRDELGLELGDVVKRTVTEQADPEKSEAANAV